MGAIKKYSFLICFVLPILVFLGYKLGGWFNFITPLLVFGILPVLDLFIGGDPTNPTDSEVIILQNEKYYRYITYIWSYLQFVLVIWSTYAFATTEMELYEMIGFVLSVGVCTGGIGITVAHELGHKNTKFEQFLSKLTLMTVCYMHFFIEHNKGHHVKVSTYEDPATARIGESFYTFYLRTVVGSYFSAWNIEKKRLEKKGVRVWSFQNEMILYWISTFCFSGFLFFGISYMTGSFQWLALIFFFLQSWFAFSLLELVNYIEHYGLRRKEISPGKYEKVLPIHSWNSNYLVSNAFLFHLQRHSDHHANAGRRYQVLRDYQESPQLPAGYETMVLLALIPPLWNKVMNPQLEKWQKDYYGEKKSPSYVV